MAYEKQTWTCGETITADKLNHIETGLEDASGGGIELIKLKTVQGGGNKVCVEGYVYYYTGGGGFGGETLGEILHGKKPIGYAVSMKNANGVSAITTGVTVYDSQNKVYDLVADQNETGYEQCIGAQAIMLYYSGGSSNPITGGTTFDIYAVCI